jgi:hypothetical protein
MSFDGEALSKIKFRYVILPNAAKLECHNRTSIGNSTSAERGSVPLKTPGEVLNKVLNERRNPCRDINVINMLLTLLIHFLIHFLIHY